MDQYCIDLGFLLDASQHRTLERPDRHSVHCLVDEKPCRDSGFVVLTDPALGSNRYTLGYRLDDDGNRQLLNLAREVGSSCSTCNGGGTVRRGMRAGIVGTVVDASAKPPIIQVTSAVYVEQGTTTFCVETKAPTDAPTISAAPTGSHSPTLVPTATTEPTGSHSPTTAPVESVAAVQQNLSLVLVLVVALGGVALL